MFDRSIIDAAKAHALAEFPKEACGVIVGNVYLPCENIADDPTATFLIQSSLVEAYIISEQLQGVIHSHPFAKLTELSSPSATDITGQMNTGVPWGIIDTDGSFARDPYWFGDPLLDEPLIGTEFHHGVRDCYVAVRKWFWQKRGIKLTDIPRDDKWWVNSPSLYVEHFERCGFQRISLRDIQDGDCLLGKVNAKVVNHAAIYLSNELDGRGTLYHHLPGRLSRRESAAPWLSRADMIVRYNAN